MPFGEFGTADEHPAIQASKRRLWTLTLRRQIAGAVCLSASLLFPGIVLGQTTPAPNLPRQIAQMPAVDHELSVVHHQSQLIVSRGRINRLGIADPRIIDVVQYSPTEISIVGTGVGATTLTLWFEEDPRPLVYLVNVQRDSLSAAQQPADFTVLEKKLAVLYPSAGVSLVPLSGKLIVKGRAASAEESTRILEIIREEILHLGLAPNRAPTTPVQTTGLRGSRTGNPRTPDPLGSYIVNMLEVEGRDHLQLRIRIAEVDRGALDRMKVDWSGIFERNRAANAAGNPGATRVAFYDAAQFDEFLNVLVQRGAVRILDAPTLTVVNGQPAGVLSQAGQNGSTAAAGCATAVNVVPSILDQQRIRVQLAIELLETDPARANLANGGTRVNTTVDISRGQTVAMTGLVRGMAEQQVQRLVEDNSLFSRRQRTVTETWRTPVEKELLVLITPQAPNDPNAAARNAGPAIAAPARPTPATAIPQRTAPAPNTASGNAAAKTSSVAASQPMRVAAAPTRQAAAVPSNQQIQQPAPSAMPQQTTAVTLPRTPYPAAAPSQVVSSHQFAGSPQIQGQAPGARIIPAPQPPIVHPPLAGPQEMPHPQQGQVMQAQASQPSPSSAAPATSGKQVTQAAASGPPTVQEALRAARQAFALNPAAHGKANHTANAPKQIAIQAPAVAPPRPIAPPPQLGFALPEQPRKVTAPELSFEMADQAPAAEAQTLDVIAEPMAVPMESGAPKLLSPAKQPLPPASTPAVQHATGPVEIHPRGELNSMINQAGLELPQITPGVPRQRYVRAAESR